MISKVKINYMINQNEIFKEVGQRKKILIIEDEWPLLEAIKLKLKKNNFEMLTAISVEEALNHLKNHEKIDAIWLDHYLFGKSTGLDFVEEIKKDNSLWKRIPIFVVSNTASEEKIKLYLKWGVTRYFLKSEKKLVDIIDDIINYLNAH